MTKQRKTESNKRMKLEYKAEVRSVELAAMTSGGTPENPRFFRERRRRIKAIFNTTEQGRLARHFKSTKYTWRLPRRNAKVSVKKWSESRTSRTLRT